MWGVCMKKKLKDFLLPLVAAVLVFVLMIKEPLYNIDIMFVNYVAGNGDGNVCTK